jgi:hypothetical protein
METPPGSDAGQRGRLILLGVQPLSNIRRSASSSQVHTASTKQWGVGTFMIVSVAFLLQ